MSGAPLVMPTRMLVVGGGAREHALAWKLGAEPGVNEIAVAPGSAAIDEEPRVRRLEAVDPLDGDAVVAAARAFAAELVVIGPEAPLAAGVVDRLEADGIAVFGPTAAAARIESSKAFCREVAQAAGVPMAAGRSFRAGEARAAVAFAERLARDRAGVVVKADGLAAGKGVTVCDGIDEAATAIGALDGPIVVEERLVGREVSLIAIADGADALALPFARDHKRLLDGDRGPNTGGMGAFSPVPDAPDELADDLVDRFHRPILSELARRGTPFRGALYAGLMLTVDGPRLLECNARLGDPESQVLLPRLAAPLGPVLLAAARGRLGEARRALGVAGARLPALPIAAVGIVLAAAGYPDAPVGGDPIDGIETARAAGTLVFHAGTERGADGVWRTRGGRVLTIVGRGPDLAAARAAASTAADRISWPGVQRRHDIAVSIDAAGAHGDRDERPALPVAGLGGAR
jgi:phosphoribosylamine--glycine ligase